MATKEINAVDATSFPNTVIIDWAALPNGDEGEAAEYPHYPDKTVTINGVLGTGGAMRILGSNDGVNWVVLNDPFGNALTYTALNKMAIIHENPRYIKPDVTAGDGTTAFDVVITAAKGTR